MHMALPLHKWEKKRKNKQIKCLSFPFGQDERRYRTRLLKWTQPFRHFCTSAFFSGHVQGNTVNDEPLVHVEALKIAEVGLHALLLNFLRCSFSLAIHDAYILQIYTTLVFWLVKKVLLANFPEQQLREQFRCSFSVFHYFIIWLLKQKNPTWSHLSIRTNGMKELHKTYERSSWWFEWKSRLFAMFTDFTGVSYNALMRLATDIQRKRLAGADG